MCKEIFNKNILAGLYGAALHYAAGKVGTKLQKNSYKNMQRCQSFTCSQGFKDVVDILLTAGANVDILRFVVLKLNF
jgi:hypothetical protein